MPTAKLFSFTTDSNRVFPEGSTNLLIKQTEIAKKQYEETLAQLVEVNRTVTSLIDLVGRTKRALEDKLAWLATSLGGTDLALERLYTITWHMAMLLGSMISCAFLGAPRSVRVIVAGLPPVNLALALNGNESAVGPFSLIMWICGLAAGKVSDITKY